MATPTIKAQLLVLFIYHSWLAQPPVTSRTVLTTLAHISPDIHQPPRDSVRFSRTSREPPRYRVAADLRGVLGKMP
jgi:hypothetical protein